MKNQKERTTKQVIVPAKYFLQEVIEDTSMMYPVQVSVVGRGGGSTHTIHSASEIQEILKAKQFFECGVIRATKKNGRMYVDLMKEGNMLIPINLLPHRYHMSTLVRKDVAQLYQECYK